jgi:hypothetical protein
MENKLFFSEIESIVFIEFSAEQSKMLIISIKGTACFYKIMPNHEWLLCA